MEGLRRPRRGIRGLRLLWALCSCGVLLAIVVPAAFPAGAKTTRVSVSSAGVQGNERSSRPSISADGRFVAFESWASDLVADDTNRFGDVFVHDRSTGKTTRVSLSAAGAQANGDSSNPSISADGRFVAFESWAPNLAAGDTNHNTDVFVHNRKTGKTTRVSVSTATTQGNAPSSRPSISAGGRRVAFASVATNLVGGDTNDATDVFVRGPLR